MGTGKRGKKRKPGCSVSKTSSPETRMFSAFHSGSLRVLGPQSSRQRQTAVAELLSLIKTGPRCLTAGTADTALGARHSG